MVKIKKEEITIVAYTRNYRITGHMYIPPGGRLSDFLSGTGSKKFIPVTNAVITDISGKNVCKATFIELNRDKIIFLLPARELEFKKYEMEQIDV